jgi:phage portal protein BeeE
MADRPPLTHAEWEAVRREWIGKDLGHLQPAEQIAERIEALHAERDAAYELIGHLITNEFRLVRKKRSKR